MKIYSSAGERGFFIEGVNDIIPDDSLVIDKNTYDDLLEKNQKMGLQIDFAVFPPACREVVLTREEIIKKTELYKSTLIDSAGKTISLWQTKLLLGRISDEEKVSLNAWLDYIDSLQALDVSYAPDINWPQVPE
ncbi:tail fiber assembly protein [Pantoea sp. GM01]|uniref:tail fiber assembly protein n=1 Tax=Pantoea sp. GM01 TaxID=1144320 RepID=UPI000270DA37|nr:tail fiber assembly protein [Pantoea sp. GM01]EJL88017.1 Caudovirales tail fiber assembly protein [Pantoea sp. GM01]